jgi:hypothetical protein
MGIVDPIMNIDPMLKMIMINVEKILKSTPDLTTIPVLLQHQLQDVTDQFNVMIPIIQNLFQDRLDQMNVFYVSVMKELVDEIGKFVKAGAKEINDNIESERKLINRNRADILDQLYENHSETMKRIAELDDIASGRNDVIRGAVEESNETLKELRTSNLQIKLGLSGIEPVIKSETKKVLEELVKINPELEKMNKRQMDVSTGVTELKILIPEQSDMIKGLLDNIEMLIKDQDIKQEMSLEENQKFIRTVFDKLWNINNKVSENGEEISNKLSKIKGIINLIRVIGEKHQISIEETQETINLLIKEVESIKSMKADVPSGVENHGEIVINEDAII